MMEMLKGLLSGELPNLGELFAGMGGWLRIVVMAGPVCMTALGLLYLFASPKEANHRFGYRCYFGMGSVEAWQYSQRLAGTVWAALGAVLAVVMLVRCRNFGDMSGYDAAVSAAWSVAWQIGALLVSNLGIHIAVAMQFDRKGNRRTKV